MIRQTVYAVSENTAKPIYTGSLYEIEDGVFKIIAIDGYRMAIRSENVDSESKIVLLFREKLSMRCLNSSPMTKKIRKLSSVSDISHSKSKITELSPVLSRAHS